MVGRWAGAACWLVCILLSACSTAPLSVGNDTTHWQGRLAIKVYSTPVKAFSASFELQGTPSRGTLLLSSALGTTLAQLEWSENSASLRTANEARSFDSLESLARQATGADIPVTSLFAWLQGEKNQAAHWESDLSQLTAGRITAHTTDEATPAELKIILDR